MTRSTRLLRFAALTAAVSILIVALSVLPSSAQTTHPVRVGGEITGANFTAGVVWFNGYDPGTIVIRPGDSIEWTVAGGVHTVTSTAALPNGSFAYDSSPLFSTQAALDDIGPGKLLGPGAVYELDTSGLSPGTYTYICKIHPGMRGTLTITLPPVAPPEPIVNVVAGFGDSVFAQQAFAPASITVAQGTIVRWTLMNPTEPHTITHETTGAPAFDSSPLFNPPGPPPVLLPGQKFSRTFSTAGTFTYFCKLHAYNVGGTWVGMVGTVLVVPVTALDAVSAAASSATTLGYVSLALAAIALAVAIYAVARRKPAQINKP